MYMNDQKQQFYFLIIILLGTFALTFFIFRPFLHALVLAMVFAAVFKPIHKKISVRFNKWQGLAALATTVIISAVIFVPLMLLGAQIFREAGQLYYSLANSNGAEGVIGGINDLMREFQGIFPSMQGFSIDIDRYIKQGLELLLQNLNLIFSNITRIAMSLFVFLAALYYLFRDGAKMKKVIVALSPLSDTDDEIILKKLDSAANSVVKGSLFVALIQGTLASLGFAIFGVPNPVLWGSVTAVASFVPGIGTSLVIVPAALFLFLTEGAFSGFGLLAWGVGAVGIVDNFLGPKLLGRGMEPHPMFVLLSVLGGVIFFGPVGLVLGPLTVSLLFALLDLHSSSAKKGKTDVFKI